MNFRYGSQPLSVTDVAGFVVSGEVPPESVVTCMAGFATLGRLSARSSPLVGSESAVTSMAGFATFGLLSARSSPLVGSESAVTSMAGFAVRTHPGARTWMPAAFRYPLAVSRRTPMACSMRRKDQPSRPKAIICCRLSSLNTLLMPREATLPPRVVNVPGDYFSMAGFEVTLYGRFWVTPEDFAVLKTAGRKAMQVRVLSP